MIALELANTASIARFAQALHGLLVVSGRGLELKGRRQMLLTSYNVNSRMSIQFYYKLTRSRYATRSMHTLAI